MRSLTGGAVTRRSLRALVATALCVSGVDAKPRLYPICFYNNTRPAVAEYTKYYVPMLKEALRVAGQLNRHAAVAESPDGRWLVADTSDAQNLRLAAPWSRLGCIGDASNSDRVLVEQNCATYISNFIKRGNVLSFGRVELSGVVLVGEAVLKDNVLHCRSVLTSSDP